MNPVVLNGGLIYANDGMEHLTGSTLTVNPVTGGTLQNQFGDKPFYIDDQIVGTGPLALDNTGAGGGTTSVIHITNNTNTYSGTVTVNGTSGAGLQLSVDANNALADATVNVNGTGNGSTLLFTTTAPNFGALSGTGNFAVGTGVVLTVGGNNAPGTYTGVLSGAGGLTKTGTGTLTLTGAGGPITIGTLMVNNGTVAMSNNNIVTNTNLVVNSPGILSQTSGGGEIFGNLNGNGTVNFTGGIFYTTGGTFSGTYNGVASYNMLGPGTQIMSGANTYLGTTQISSGILSTGSTGVLANGGVPSSIGESSNIAANLLLGNATLQYANTGAAESTDRLFTMSSTAGTLDASGMNPVTFAGNGVGAANAIAFSGTGTCALTLTGTNTGPNTLAPIIGDGAGGATSLSKTGLGTWVLSNANTYSGGTLVSSGTLMANGPVATSSSSSTGTGNVTIEPGASLGGSGSVFPTGSSRTVSIPDGGTILGTAGQTLTINGTLSLAANAANTSSIASVAPSAAYASTPLITANTLNVPSGANTAYINITNGASLGAGTYDLISYTSGPSAASPAANFGFTSGITFAAGHAAVLQTTGSQLDLLIVGPITWTGTTGVSSDGNWTTSTADTNWASGSYPTATASQYLDGAAVTFADNSPLTNMLVPNSSGMATVTLSGAVSPDSITFTNDGAAHSGVDYLISGSGSINGSTGITLSGTGNVYLATANTFGGNVNVNAGQLILESNAALGATPAVTVFPNAALGLQTTTGGALGSFGSTAAGSSTTLAGNGPTGNGALVSISGANTYTGAIAIASGGATIGSLSNSGSDGLTLTGGINAGGTLTLVGAGPITVSTIGISGNGGLTYSGTGTLTLAASNSYIGATQVNSGTLRVAAPAPWPPPARSPSVEQAPAAARRSAAPAAFPAR